MLRVERAARAIFAMHGIDLDALEMPDGFEEPTGWTMAFVAEVEGHVVGMARLSELEDDVLVLDQLSVDPAYAGRGLGRQLLVAVARAAQEQGYAAVTGTTFRDRLQAVPRR